MAKASMQWIDGGSVTSPRGFVAGATYTGVKTYGPEPRLDLAILASEGPSQVAGVFTQSAVVGAPVTLCRNRIRDGRGRAVVVNSGCSNVATGTRGLADAHRMADVTAQRLDVDPSEVLVASTGVIGRRLPMERIEPGIPSLDLSREGGGAFARAIMTTDTVAKSCALRVHSGDRVYTVGGCAKGSGMVHPDMATVLCFMTTDAPAEAAWLARTLQCVADRSLNMLDVDTDTSTSDSMLLFANGAASGPAIDDQCPTGESLREGLEAVAIELTRALARDGEGARTLIEVRVEGAASEHDARRAARTIVSSPLVKTMVTGRDANMGRVLMALGRSGCAIELERTRVFVGDHCAFDRGEPSDVELSALSEAMNRDEVKLRLELGMGQQSATAWGCDLTEGYVRINADYTT